ncbi:MAG: hypothetical protein HC829_08745 [Bacteroidales bacterium]|nr:hypothetical protein [Bacteroidales bacterium]
MVIPPWNYPPLPPLKPLRKGWREYLASLLVVAILLAGAVILERFGLWPESLKTARSRQFDALKQQQLERDRLRLEQPSGQRP